jgi:hypothetical protein
MTQWGSGCIAISYKIPTSAGGHGVLRCFMEFLSSGLDDHGSKVRFLARAGNFSLHHRVQNGSGAHPAYPLGTRGSFHGGKAVGA